MKTSTALVLGSVAAFAAGDLTPGLFGTPPPNPSPQRDTESAVAGAVLAGAVWGLTRGKKGILPALAVGAALGLVGGRVGMPGATK